ncbi:hypothetical protein [Vibrio casei]|uniref:Uncharacterized protein n=1 Tax=Vibrio casei TaxID=673372 RepID=A0A368LIQ4_9VIBR|nr:hypothetical protein [Vibrio casei]RCS70578.1 hypothetical protein CIK83_14270 [Vibrio casei]
MTNRTAIQKSYLDQCLSAARAICQVSNLTYQGQRFYVGDQPLYFLAVHVNDLSFQSQYHMENDRLSLRGKADSIALRLQHSDQRVHFKNRPTPDIARLIFDFCEQVRVERLAPVTLPGVMTNVSNNFFYWCQYQYQNGFTETRIGMLIFTCLLVIRCRLFGVPVHHDFDALIESTRMGIVPLIGDELFSLPKCLFNQEEYAHHACQLAKKIQLIIDEQQTQHDESLQNKFDDDIKILKQVALMVDGEIEEKYLQTLITEQSKTKDTTQEKYQIFTQEYDQVVQVDTLVRKVQLDSFRVTLNTELHLQNIPHYRLASILSNTIKTPENTGQVYQQEEGIVDARSLHQLITNPMQRQIFINRRCNQLTTAQLVYC